MEPASKDSTQLQPSQIQQSQLGRPLSPSKSVTSFKSHFFSLIRSQQESAKVEKFLLQHRKILNEKVISHMFVAEPKLYAQFRYLLLGLSLTLDRKQDYSLRWSTFYELINEILKIPDNQRKCLQIQLHTMNFTFFLLENKQQFFQQFSESFNLIENSNYKIFRNNEKQNVLLVKRIIRIFNSLLCLKFVKVSSYIMLILAFGMKSPNLTELLIGIQDKFVKKLAEFQANEKKDSMNSQSYPQILSLMNIFYLLFIFSEMDPDKKLKELLKQQLKLENDKNNRANIDLLKQLQTIESKKSNKNQHIKFDKLQKFILKQVIRNKMIKKVNKKQFILECFNQIQQIDEELFDYLLEAEGLQEDEQISDLLMRIIQKEALRFITVSRIKSILKRINLAKTMTYSFNMKKIFRILRLLYWLAKKFNESDPTYMLQLNSSIKIANIDKAMMIIFSIDFAEAQVGRVIQFQVNKKSYDILIKYTQAEDSSFIEVITQVDGQQKLKEKKQIGKWSYVLCIVGLYDKKNIGIFIDGAYFTIPLNQNASKITNVEFGPFQGSIKDVYILDKVYDMHEIHKKYFQKFRKMDQLLAELGEKQFIFTFEKGKLSQKSKWFWKKQMTVQFKNARKLRSISFGEGVQQLGGFPALLFLITRIITTEKSDDLVSFLADFFEFLKLLINESQFKFVEKWMQASTAYFGEFLWLILNRNQHLRGQKMLFNRIFDFFGWFFNTVVTERTINLRLSILSDIYLNFQIWSKCSTQIKLMLFNQISTKIQPRQSLIFYQMFLRKDYQKVMSSIVFFFIDQNPQQGPETHFISGVIASLVHDQISKLGSKFCQLYLHEKVAPNCQEIIKRDLTLLISLINSFFQKQKLYFSRSQLSAIAVLLSHYAKNFTTLFALEKTLDYQIFVFDKFTKFMEISPSQSQILYLLFQLSFILMAQLQGVKNGTALILDRLTLTGKRAEDTLQFSFRNIIHIIKTSRILYQPSQNFVEEQVLSVLVGSIRNKAQAIQKYQWRKLNYQDFVTQFQKFPRFKLVKLFSLNEFCMLIKQACEQDDVFLISVFFLSIILKEQILPEAQPLAISCIKIINLFLMQKKVKSTKNENLIMQEHEKIDQKGKESQIIVEGLQKNIIEEAIQKLRELLINTQLQLLLKTCRSPDLLKILIELEVVHMQYNAVTLPSAHQSWFQSKRNTFSTILLCLFKQGSPLLDQQMQILLDCFKNISTQIVGQQIIKDDSVNLVTLVCPLYIINSCLTNLLQDSQKNCSKVNFERSLSLINFQQMLKAYSGLKANKNSIQNIIKKQEYEAQARRAELVDLSSKITIEAGKYKTQNTSLEAQLKDLIQKLGKGADRANIKAMKKLNEQTKQILQLFMLYFQVVHSKKLVKISKQKSNPMSPSIIRRKTIQGSKKKKLLQIMDNKKIEQNYQNLKNTLRNLCVKLQNQSKKKQELWKTLNEQNKFWVSSRIKNNQCYEIHPKITGFYRLNIVKTAFEEVPYPRRKSFDHQILQNNHQEVDALQKMTGNELIKAILPMEESESMERSTSATLLNQSSNIKADSKPPKDSFFAEYVTQRGVYAGILYYSAQDQCLIFKCKGYSSLPSSSNVYQLSTIFHRIDDLQMKIAIQINQKSQIFARKYIHRHTAIEVYSYQKTYFFNLFFKDIRDKFLKTHSNKFTCISDLRVQFQKKKYTEKWINGDLDNFQYLMLVNIFSGRTVNDLAQYPVMPWVITNYDIEQCELNKQFLKDPKNIRDLTIPSGKLNPKKFENLKMRCNQIQPQDQQSKFLYGTMYSNPTVIYNFFIRLEPFTTLHWEHQGQRIDHADRLFSAVRDQFNTVLTSTSDNKQLVPEFYYWPEFLKNRNKVNLGTKQNKEQVHDVKLPGWAKNPEQFIFKMRQVLESPDVTYKLHQWIDLIFGYKSPRDVALEYDNLFHYRSYQHDIFETEESEQAIKGAQISISEFGQIPSQLFIKPHPQKTLGYSQHFKLDTPITIRKQSNKNIINFSMPNQGIFFCYDKQVQFFPQESQKILDSTLQKPAKAFSSQGSIVKLCDFDNSIWFTLKEGVFRIFQKKNCVLETDLEMECFQKFGRYILYGYRSELIVTKIQSTYRLNKISSLFGHKSNIYLIEISMMLDIVVSIDEGGLVLIHQFSKQKLMRQFELGSNLVVTDLCIHEMGYFIFFTKCQKLIIYTFLGQLFLNQDIGITNKAISENITKVAIFQQNRSLLLISTDKGKIYLIDFLQIKRFNQNCVYKQFSRFKNNILENCPRLGSAPAIRDFYFKKVAGKDVITYKFYVLYQNNQIICYYSSEQFQVKLKSNRLLSQLGLFDSSK